jgi:hypothetical protein
MAVLMRAAVLLLLLSHNGQEECHTCCRKNDTYKARFFDYMTALATRENVFTRIQARVFV